MASGLSFVAMAALVASCAAHRESIDLANHLETDRAGAPCSDIGSKTAYGGAGGNAYVLRFTGACGKVPKGSVAKAFQDSEEASQAVSALRRLPDVPALAGLVSGPAEFDAKCVHVHTDTDCCSSWKPSEQCHFMVMKSGGTRTLEQCTEQKKIVPDKIKGLVLASIDAALSFHKQGWYHNDYQLKNLMTDANCDPGSLKVVDLDGMDNKDGTPESAWNKPHRMFRDYAMLLGECDMGALPLDEFEYANPKAKAMASKVKQVTEPLMKPLCSSPWNLTPDKVVELGGSLKAAVEAVQ